MAQPLLGQGDGMGSGEVGEAGDVFADDVELKVDHGADFDVAEVGVGQGIGDDGHGEAVRPGVADGERNAIDRDGAFFDGEVASLHELAGHFVGKGELYGAVELAALDAAGGAVNMALHYVSVEAFVHHHGALKVDAVAGAQEAEVGAAESFFDGGDGVGRLLGQERGDGEAHSVVGHGLVDFEVVGE